MHPLFKDLEMLSSGSDKAKLLAKNVSRNSNQEDSGITLPVFSSRTNLKLHNISMNPKMVKKVLISLICQGHLVLIAFQWWF